MLALPVVLPKIKGFDIIEGDIEDDEVTEKMCNYHPVVIEWLSSIKYKFFFNKLLQNDIQTPTVHADIKVTSEIDLLLEIPFRSAKPASIYQIMHSKAKAVITLNKKEDELQNNSNNNINQNNNCINFIINLKQICERQVRKTNSLSSDIFLYCHPR